MREFVICINSNFVNLSEKSIEKIINICKNQQIIITSNFTRIDDQLKSHLKIGKFGDYYKINDYLYEKIDAFIFIKSNIKFLQESHWYIRAKKHNKKIRIIIQQQ